MPAYVLAHLSDPHLGPIPRPRVGELLNKRAIGYLNWWRKRRWLHNGEILRRLTTDLTTQPHDHLAVTGDLVNISLPGEFAPALAWLESLGAPRDVTLVPGNHDAYVRGAAQQAQMHWNEYLRGDESEGGSQGDAFPFVRRRGPIALIGVSSAVPTAPLMASGHVGTEQLSRLGEALDRLSREELFRVVLVHHPLFTKRSHHLRRLVDGEALRTTLAQHGAELVLHGHAHTHSVKFIEQAHGRIPIVGVPSASERPPGEHDAAAYNLYRIEGAPLAWRCEVISRGFTGDGQGVIELKRFALDAN
jgi:3',5'-cyclic AMP phosphodiesterase CpdA